MKDSIRESDTILTEEASRRAYEPYVGENDCWEESYVSLSDIQAGYGEGHTSGPRGSYPETDGDADFEGLEINLDDALYWREGTFVAKKMKGVLIVEDEAILRDSLRDWLIDSGYRAEIAGEGEEALKVIEQSDFNLMLLDLKLPGKNGLDVLREAKAKRPNVKGIIITAYPEVQSAVEAMKLGAIDFLTKPLDLENLERLVAANVRPN